MTACARSDTLLLLDCVRRGDPSAFYRPVISWTTICGPAAIGTAMIDQELRSDIRHKHDRTGDGADRTGRKWHSGDRSTTLALLPARWSLAVRGGMLAGRRLLSSAPVKDGGRA